MGKENFLWISCMLLVFWCIKFSTALTPSTYLTTADTARMKNIFNSALTSSDLPTIHYAVSGLNLLEADIPDTQTICKLVNSKLGGNLESIFHATSVVKLLSNCEVDPTTNLPQKFGAILSDSSSVSDIYYSFFGMRNLGLNVDSTKVSKLLVSSLKKDDSLWNLGYAFKVASKLQGDLKMFFERIEDVIVQADELDGKYLQFEGGLVITSTIISGIYNLAETVKKAPVVTPDQVIKFTNYFLSRKFVQTVKGAAHLLNVLEILSTNKFHIPVTMTVASGNAVSVKDPMVQVKVTDVLGKSLGPLSVVVDSLKSDNNALLLSKKSFQSVKDTSSLYSFNLMEQKPQQGFYRLSITATPSKVDSRFVGNTGAEMNVKVMTEVSIEDVEIGTADRDQATAGKATGLAFPSQLSKILEVDYHQKIFMKFILRDVVSKSTMQAHQVFVHFINEEHGQEGVFVAESDSSNNYRFDLDIHLKAKDFAYTSGIYNINLIIGDAVILNSLKWNIGQIHLTFPSNPSSSKFSEHPFVMKPEIKHLFREQEKRPSTLVSNTFSVLVLMPLLLLFVSWFNLGANIYNFHLSLSAIGFHLGISATFGLFICFWIQLNMFSTLKYLSGISVFTFLTGHRLLSSISDSRKL